jgi:hypothetical protein
MDKIDWKAVGRAALAFFLKYILPAIAGGGTVAAAYECCK